MAPDSTAPGASQTPTVGPEPRRSARVASRLNTESASKTKEENTPTPAPRTTSISQPTRKPKLIPSTNQTKPAVQKNRDQAAQDKDVIMADSTNEPARKNRRVGGGAPRHTQGPAGQSAGPNFEAPARSLPEGGNAPGAANPAFGHGNRSGRGGPSSGQQSTRSGRHNTNEEAQPSTNQRHRVPGMPAVMPRSDTPPPRFDTTNPYSAFSEQPAIPQRRPSTAGRSTIPTSLPSLPSDEALTNALHNSIQNQANMSQGKLDYRDPNWRHPWGVPVEPAPPIPQPYVYVNPQERVLREAEAARAAQAKNQAEEYYGLDEHIPLGHHPLDMEYANFLFNHRGHGDGSNYMSNAGNSRVFGNAPLVSNPPATASNVHHAPFGAPAAPGSQYAASNVHRGGFGAQPAAPSGQYAASNVHRGAFGAQPAAPSGQYAASNVHRGASGVHPATSNAQSAGRNPQAAAPGVHPGGRAGDMNNFPNYPYGYDVHNANPPVTNKAVNQAPASGAFALLNNQAQSLARQGAGAEDVRRASLAASIMGSLASEKGKAEKNKGKRKAPADQPTQPTQHNYQSQPDFQNLALGKIRLAKVTPVGNPTCTFCLYDCDWGVSDERFRLPEDASTGECEDCSANAGIFWEEWTTIMEDRTDEASKEALAKALEEPVPAKPAADHAEKVHSADHAEKVYSSIDGKDITKFMGPMFCKTSPYGQLDVTKVRMCQVHKDEKFAIIKHHRHREFRVIGWAMAEDALTGDKVRKMNMNDAEDRVREEVANQGKVAKERKENRRCMMCTGYATDICADCPLRLCPTCSGLLKNMCKGYLDNLFYHYERHHLRNDAFLLRSDGGGF